MTTTLSDLEDHARFVAAHPVAVVYYTTPDCSVCKVLKPKLAALLAERFPAAALAWVDCSRSPELAAQQSVFAVPTLVVWLDGREGLRNARSFSLAVLEEELARPYALLCEP